MSRTEINPCPFYGESLVEHFDHHGDWWAHKDETGPCIAAHIQLLHKEDFVAWNRRIVDRTLEFISKLAERRCYGGFPNCPDRLKDGHNRQNDWCDPCVARHVLRP